MYKPVVSHLSSHPTFHFLVFLTLGLLWREMEWKRNPGTSAIAGLWAHLMVDSPVSWCKMSSTGFPRKCFLQRIRERKRLLLDGYHVTGLPWVSHNRAPRKRKVGNYRKYRNSMGISVPKKKKGNPKLRFNKRREGKRGIRSLELGPRLDVSFVFISQRNPVS